MKRTIVDVHVVQTLPPSNVNRDDTGSPKTAVYGGVRRARVSSQAWKKATRDDFRDRLDTADLGIRTKRVVELLAEEITSQAPGLAERAAELAAAVLKAVGIKLSKPRQSERTDEESGYLILVSAMQVRAMAALAVAAGRDGTEPDKKAAREAFRKDNSIDLALFGRMVADVSDLGVDAAAQVAHAISVHSVENEYDYFTAVDDAKADGEDEDSGAGMIGTVEFNSSTLYRYATLDVDALHHNLGDEKTTARGVQAFLQAFVTSMPTGKQNTFAHRTLPDAVVLSVRSDQPVSWVGAFEDPITAGASGGRVSEAIRRLSDYATEIGSAYSAPAELTVVTGIGNKIEPLTSLGERIPFDSAVERVSEAVLARMDDGQ